MTPNRRSLSRNHDSRAVNFDPLSQPRSSRAAGGGTRSPHSTRNRIVTSRGRARSESTSRRHQSPFSSHSVSGLQRASNRITRSTAHSSTSARGSLNSVSDSVTSTASSFSKMKTALLEHLNSLSANCDSLDTLFTTCFDSFGDLNFTDNERIFQKDSKHIFDKFWFIQKSSGILSTEFDDVLEKFKMLFISPDPCKCICENKQEDIDVSNYNTSRLVCSVCYCDLLKPDVSVLSTVCGHIYCHDCLIQVINVKDSKCPNCRRPLDRCDYHQIYLSQLLV